MESFAGKQASNVVRHSGGYTLVGGIGDAGDVGRGDDVGAGEQWCTGIEWLLVEYVESRTGQAAVGESVQERLVIEQPAPARVDHAGLAGEQRQGVGVDKPMGLLVNGRHKKR